MFNSFAQRSQEAELMDGSDYTVAEMIDTLADLRRVNRYLGGLSAITRHLFPMIQTVWKTNRRPIRLLDVGSGSADIPERIVLWARGRGINVECVALDLNENIAVEARQRTESFHEINVVQADALKLPFEDRSFDFAIASMFMHHLDTPSAARLIEKFSSVSRVAFIINDLRRHPIAYYSIKALTRVFTRNRLVRNDSAVSVMRGFTEADIAEIALAAHTELQVFRHFPYRFIMIGRQSL